ncbi:MAG: bifunctional nuclease family protein [Spirochaetaceae bacterium]
MKEYTVKGMALHRETKVPFVVLEQLEEHFSLPLPVGTLEASSILMELEGAVTPQPSTHDLLAHFFLRHRFKVTKVIISHVDEEFSAAVIHYRKGPLHYSIESLPSDAIALALRLGVSIFLTENAAADARKNLHSKSMKDSESLSYLYVEPEKETDREFTFHTEKGA